MLAIDLDPTFFTLADDQQNGQPVRMGVRILDCFFDGLRTIELDIRDDSRIGDITLHLMKNIDHALVHCVFRSQNNAIRIILRTLDDAFTAVHGFISHGASDHDDTRIAIRVFMCHELGQGLRAHIVVRIIYVRHHIAGFIMFHTPGNMHTFQSAESL